MARRDRPQPTSETKGLGRRTARGFYWLMVQTVGSKGVTLLSQVALGWLLAPEDFDLIALMLTFTTILSLLRDAGMREVLVHRHRNFSLWAGAAFWLSLTTGMVVGLLTVACIPIALAIYQKPQLEGLLLISAIAAPINTLGTVSDALVRSQMRFRLLSMVGLGVYTGTMMLTVILAALGFGAYSWVIPHPVLWLVRAGVLWWVARPNFSLRPRFRRWRYLLGDNLRLIGADFALNAALQGDRAVLGIMFPLQAFAGIYFFAINLTAQSVRLFVQNLTNVLFPALTKLQDDPVRQGRAYLRATSLLALVAVPLCLVQAPIADPLIKLIFPAKWYPAIGVVQLLSFGMVGRLMTAPSRGMLMAQGRFNVLMWMAALNAISFLGCVILGAALGGLIGVALMASIAMFLYGPVQIYVAARPSGATVRDVLRTYALPLMGSAAAIVFAWGAGLLFASVTRELIVAGAAQMYPSDLRAAAAATAIALWCSRIVELISIVVLTFIVYIAIVARFAPHEMKEVRARLRDVLSRTRKRKPTQEEMEKDAAEVEAAERITAPGD